MKDRQFAFSLVEVVLALGVVSFAIVAIFGLIPTGLQTSHSSQDETRAAQLAQAILSSMASQAPTQFASVQLPLNDNSTAPTFNLSSTSTATIQFYASNDGKLVSAAANSTYAITVTTNGSPTGLDPGYVNQVTVRVMWPLVPNQGPTPAPNQTYRDYVRLVSKY